MIELKIYDPCNAKFGWINYPNGYGHLGKFRWAVELLKWIDDNIPEGIEFGVAGDAWCPYVTLVFKTESDHILFMFTFAEYLKFEPTHYILSL